MQSNENMLVTLQTGERPYALHGKTFGFTYLRDTICNAAKRKRPYALHRKTLNFTYILCIHIGQTEGPLESEKYAVCIVERHQMPQSVDIHVSENSVYILKRHYRAMTKAFLETNHYGLDLLT